MNNDRALVDNIGRVVRNIILSAPHWGFILSGVSRRLSETIGGSELPTACAHLDGLGMGITMNPKFMETLTEGEKTFVILHELLHIVWLHPLMIRKYSDPEVFNLAADLEINQHVAKIKGAELPVHKEGELKGQVGALMLEHFGLDPKRDSFKGVKFYYDYLMKRKNAIKQFLDGHPSLKEALRKKLLTGTHKDWEKTFNKLDKSKRELIKGGVRNRMATSLANAGKDVLENLPGDLRSIILDLLNRTPQYDYKKILRRLLTGYSTITYIKPSRRKLSRRFPDMAGNKLHKSFKVMCGIDTSGSMDDEEIIGCFVEVGGVKKMGGTVTVVECDAGIDKDRGVYEFKSLEQLRERNMVTGGGGTSFDPVIQYFKDNEDYSLLLYFTDGMAPAPTIKVNRPIVWVLSSDGLSIEQLKENGFYGLIIKISKEEEDEN